MMMLAVLVLGTGVHADAPAPDAKVVISNFSFTPGTLTVPVGTTVTWVNRDSEAHAVESKDKGFPSSPTLEVGKKYSYTFTQAGTYPYYCSIHTYMTGTVVVTEAKTN